MNVKINKYGIYIAYIFLLFLCFVTYGDTLTHKFMIDDYGYILPKANISIVCKNLADAFSKPLDHHYSPFNISLNTVLFYLFQKPFPLYLINICLLFVDCGLLFYFIYVISENLLASLLTSALFCVHPMTGDMLQHITFNILLLQAAFIEMGLIALYQYAKFNKGVVYYFFCILMVILALFCHEIILLFPIYAGILLFYLTDLKFGRIVRLISPFVVLDIFLLLMWMGKINHHQHLLDIKGMNVNQFWDLSANYSHLFFWYISNLFIPTNIVMIATFHPLQGSILYWNLIFGVFCASCVWLIFFYFKKSLESFALLLFLTGFIFSLFASLVYFQRDGNWFFEPNWIYFSSFGFYYFFVLILLRFRKYINRFLFVFFVSLLFVAYFLCTLKIDFLSRNEISYCENWLEKFPGNNIPLITLKNYYVSNGNVKIPSDLIFDMIYTADVYIKNNDRQNAQALLKRIMSSKISLTQNEELLYSLAVYQCKYGHSDQCDEAINRIISRTNDPNIYLKLSNAFYNYVQNDRITIHVLKICIEQYPQFKEPYLLLGVVLGNEGHYQEAIKYWKQGLLIDESDTRFVLNIDSAQKLIKNGRGL